MLSLAGDFFINGRLAGNVSDFNPVIVAPNAQSPAVLQLRINDAQLIAVITNFITLKQSDLVISISATANVSGIPVPVALTFNPVP